MAIPIYILAGGKSSRFGGDKALADIGGRPMIARVAQQWSAWCARVVVVADRAGKYDAIGLKTIADIQPGLGPIGGLLTAIEDCETGWFLLAACDAMVVDATFAGRLFAENRNSVKLVAFKEGEGERWETMPALYECSIRSVVRDHVARNELALWRIIEQVAHKAVECSTDPPTIAQINTRQDWEKFRAGPAG